MYVVYIYVSGVGGTITFTGGGGGRNRGFRCSGNGISGEPRD